jgi:hypothetical protein
MESGRERDIPERIIRGPRQVRYADRFALFGGEAQDAFVESDPGAANGMLESRVERVCLGKREDFARRVIAVDRTGIRVGELDGARRDCSKHGFDVERGGDGAADLSSAFSSPTDCARSRAFGDLCSKAYEPCSWSAIRLKIRQILDFASGSGVDAMAEIARFQLLRADRQCANGTTMRCAPSRRRTARRAARPGPTARRSERRL